MALGAGGLVPRSSEGQGCCAGPAAPDSPSGRAMKPVVEAGGVGGSVAGQVVFQVDAVVAGSRAQRAWSGASGSPRSRYVCRCWPETLKLRRCACGERRLLRPCCGCSARQALERRTALGGPWGARPRLHTVAVGRKWEALHSSPRALLACPWLISSGP